MTANTAALSAWRAHMTALAIAEADQAERLAAIRSAASGPPPPRACDAITPPAALWAPAPAPVVYYLPAPAPAPVWAPAPVYRRRRSLLGWLRLVWFGSWAVLFAYGLLLAALVEVFE